MLYLSINNTYLENARFIDNLPDLTWILVRTVRLFGAYSVRTCAYFANFWISGCRKVGWPKNTNFQWLLPPALVKEIIFPVASVCVFGFITHSLSQHSLSIYEWNPKMFVFLGHPTVNPPSGMTTTKILRPVTSFSMARLIYNSTNVK